MIQILFGRHHSAALLPLLLLNALINIAVIIGWLSQSALQQASVGLAIAYVASVIASIFVRSYRDSRAEERLGSVNDGSR